MLQAAEALFLVRPCSLKSVDNRLDDSRSGERDMLDARSDEH